MKIQFKTPAVVAPDLQAHTQTTINSLQLISVAFNLAPPPGHGDCVLSVVLRDPDTGFQASYLYEGDAKDAGQTLAYWNDVKALQLNGAPWIATLLQRLQADGKLPAGTLS